MAGNVEINNCQKCYKEKQKTVWYVGSGKTGDYAQNRHPVKLQN